jgi:hypothetical protein
MWVERDGCSVRERPDVRHKGTPSRGAFVRAPQVRRNHQSGTSSNVPGGRRRRGFEHHALVAIGQQLHNETCFAFPEKRLNGAHHPGVASDLDAVSDFQRSLRVEVASRDHLVPAPKLITIVSPRHF